MRARLVVGAVAVLVLAACAPGTPDTVYSPSGSVPIGNLPSGNPVRVIPRADGGAVATGSDARPLTRITAAGTVDATWGAALPKDCRRITSAVAAGSRILMTCSHVANGTETWQIWRVTANGVLDPAFGGDGVVDAPTTLNELDVAPLPNGGTLALGHQVLPPSRTSVPPLVALVYSATGAPVSTTQIDIPLPLPELPAGFEGWRIGAGLTPTADGVIAVEQLGARFNDLFESALTRVQHFDETGAVVDGGPFAPGGSGLVSAYQIGGFEPLADGRTTIATTVTTLDFQTMITTTSTTLEMLAPDGSRDPQFGGGNTVSLDGLGIVPVSLLATNDDRSLVVAGGPVTGPKTARYDAETGALDPTYGNGGVAGVALQRIESLAPRTGVNQLYVGGIDRSGRPAVARIWNQLVP